MTNLRLFLPLFFPTFMGVTLAADPSLSPPVAIPLPVAKEVPEIEPVIISAPKLRRELLDQPLSATVSDRDFLDSAMVRSVKEAAIHAPNTVLTEFSARKLSNPRFRGIGSSPMNPGVTTYIDGVPQLSANSSSLELLDIEQIDLVRGPLGALYGRNTVGGLINITSHRPSLTGFGGEFQTTFGNYNLLDVRGSITGALIEDQLGFSIAGGHSERDGFTRNLETGHDLDSRSASFGKAQFLWTPSDELEVRFIIAGESADDGDYALGDLGSLRQNPRQVRRDFEGYTSRDVVMPTLQITYHADAFDLTSTTGYVGWETNDLTDLDYLTFPLGIRQNQEKMRTWTQEFRLANPAGEPVSLSDDLKLSWQTGLFLFHSQYQQNASNALNPPLSPVAARALTQAELTDLGIGAYVQGTLTFWDRLDMTAGLRWDYESKDADIRSRSVPALGPAEIQHQRQDFSQITPQASISYRLTPTLMTYASIASGYKAGGFNAVGPAAYEEERSWNYEIGLKGRALANKLGFSLAAFYTDWKDLQLNQPFGLNQFIIANAGDATSSGLEINLDYKLTRRISLFGSAGWQDTQFLSNATDSGVALSGKQIPFTPDYTSSLGFLIDVPVSARFNVYARADIQTIGSFNYDAQNTAAQDAYTLANFRLGVRDERWFAEAFVNNALGTEYIPLAFNYAGLAPSGFIGESGAPTTFGLRVGIRF